MRVDRLASFAIGLSIVLAIVVLVALGTRELASFVAQLEQLTS